MKHTLLPRLLLLLALGGHTNAGQAQILSDSWQPSPRYEVRAVWLTTLSGLDWPSRPARTAADTARQRQELRDIFDHLQATGINTVIFQARIRATVAYPSSIEPWDAAFSGRAGTAPPYDPLDFAVAEAHRRGMELHAWVVAFPICSVAQERQLGRDALPRLRPELCRRCGDRWMMDPGVPATADYLADICREIVSRYDVDGIHLDYIRYPEQGIPWNDAATYRRYGHGQPLADWRRDNVTRVVEHIYRAVKAVRPWVKLSCSPVGKYADLPRQSSFGWNARDAVFQEAQTWLRRGLMDMLFPMMYFDGQHFYPFALDWQEQAGGRPVVPGLGIYFLSEKEKNWPLATITRQLNFMRSLHMGGAAFFRSRFLTDDVKGLRGFLADGFYSRPALVPPMTWADSIPPTVPQLHVDRQGCAVTLTWTTAADNAPATPVRYNIYRLPPDTATLTLEHAHLIAHGLTTTSFTDLPTTATAAANGYAVTAVDAYGNECALVAGRNAIPAKPFRPRVLPHP